MPSSLLLPSSHPVPAPQIRFHAFCAISVCMYVCISLAERRHSPTGLLSTCSWRYALNFVAAAAAAAAGSGCCNGSLWRDAGRMHHDPLRAHVASRSQRRWRRRRVDHGLSTTVQLWKKGWTDRDAVWGEQTREDQRNGDAHWRHLANKTEPTRPVYDFARTKTLAWPRD